MSPATSAGVAASPPSRTPIKPLVPTPVQLSTKTRIHDEAGTRVPMSNNGTQWLPAGWSFRANWTLVPEALGNLPPDERSKYYALRECPYPKDLATFWFTHVDIPHFNVCSACFERHIWGIDFASSFHGNLKNEDSRRACNFGVPTIQTRIWPLAVSSKDFTTVSSHMKRRSSLPNCFGADGVLGRDTSTAGIRWVTLKNKTVSDFICCEACFEDHIAGAPFESQFELYQQDLRTDERRVCSLAFQYLTRGTIYSLETSDWAAFVKMATYRTALPPCAKASPVRMKTRKWYRPIRQIPGAVICETCYADYLAWTSFEKEFVLYNGENVPYYAADTTNWSCEFWHFPVIVSHEMALVTSQFELLWSTLNEVLTHPPGENGPHASGEWYTLRGGCENFDVCKACYLALGVAFDLDDLFELNPAVSGDDNNVKRTCDLALSPSHSPKYLQSLANNAINAPRIGEFVSFARKWAAIPPCIRRDSAQNRRWWTLKSPRTKDLFICEDCYESFVSSTPLSR